jgi:hypothetical protein
MPPGPPGSRKGCPSSIGLYRSGLPRAESSSPLFDTPCPQLTSTRVNAVPEREFQGRRHAAPPARRPKPRAAADHCLVPAPVGRAAGPKRERHEPRTRGSPPRASLRTLGRAGPSHPGASPPGGRRRVPGRLASRAASEAGPPLAAGRVPSAPGSTSAACAGPGPHGVLRSGPHIGRKPARKERPWCRRSAGDLPYARIAGLPAPDAVPDRLGPCRRPACRDDRPARLR